MINTVEGWRWEIYVGVQVGWDFAKAKSSSFILGVIDND